MPAANAVRREGRPRTPSAKTTSPDAAITANAAVWMALIPNRIVRR
jgi:hypothetical protein